MSLVGVGAGGKEAWSCGWQNKPATWQKVGKMTLVLTLFSQADSGEESGESMTWGEEAAGSVLVCVGGTLLSAPSQQP